MRQSKAEVYLHLVWATLGREPFLTAEIKRPVYRCIENEAKRLHCEVLAIARLMNQVKGVSSHFIHDQLPDCMAFRWQEGYGVFSIGPSQVSNVLAYIGDQKRHHVENSLHDRWEETDEAYQPRS